MAWRQAEIRVPSLAWFKDTDRSHELSPGSEDLNPIPPELRYVLQTRRIDIDIHRPSELPGTLSGPAKRPKEGSIRIEGFDPVIPGVCYKHRSIESNRDSSGRKS